MCINGLRGNRQETIGRECANRREFHARGHLTLSLGRKQRRLRDTINGHGGPRRTATSSSGHVTPTAV